MGDIRIEYISSREGVEYKIGDDRVPELLETIKSLSEQVEELTSRLAAIESAPVEERVLTLPEAATGDIRIENEDENEITIRSVENKITYNEAEEALEWRLQ